jgi:hypothetical protein
MTTLLNGLLGGLAVGVIAAGVVRFVADEPSAAADLLGRAVGGRGSSSPRTVFVAWFLYGGVAGVAFVALELHVLRLLSVPPDFDVALGLAVAWSALLFVGVFLAWRGALSRRADRSYAAELFAYHLVFGVGFAVWIRLTWIT